MNQGIDLEKNTAMSRVKTTPETVAKLETKSAVSFLAAGIGLLMVSIFNFLQDLTGGLTGPVGKFLTLHQGIGPYSGKQLYSVIIWLVAWFILNKTLANKKVMPKKIMLWAYILIGAAGLMVFPPFLELFVG